MIQVQQLATAYNTYDHFYFTFSGEMAKQLQKTVRVRSIPNIFRNKPISLLMGFILSGYYAMLEKPDVIITTGAGVVVFFCIFAKLLGAKLIFIESMAKVDKPTLTARLLYPFADLFIVQWPGLLKFFPKAKFLGRLF
jgi:UDP-N-acetylglucosamine:LPS N-acetylglucosamine transferase